jgi:hypothetical protein
MKHRTTLSFLSKAYNDAPNDYWRDMIKIIINDQNSEDIIMGHVEVSDVYIKEALGDSGICDDYKEKIKAAFPDYKPKSDYFHFGEDYCLNKSGSAASPLFIGDGLAKNGEEMRCLMVHTNYWDLEIEDAKYGPYKILKFKKKPQ